MRIKLFCKEEEYDKYYKEIKEGKIEMSEHEADFYLIQRGYTYNSILGKSGEEYTVLKPEEINYFDSIDSEVYCITRSNKYLIREKLFEVELMFSQKGFLRISKACVVNVNAIKTLKPTINMKYVLKMMNGDEVFVTRTYYYQFKEFFGL